jgi:DNA helicase-4
LKESANLKINQASSTVYWRNQRSPNEILKLEFCSMHKSKGITRDIVIVLNMNSSLMGMPARRETDPIIDKLLSHEDDFAFAEERRLFYVAITRAREATYLIANIQKPSPFVLEISDNDEK